MAFPLLRMGGHNKDHKSQALGVQLTEKYAPSTPCTEILLCLHGVRSQSTGDDAGQSKCHQHRVQCVVGHCASITHMPCVIPTNISHTIANNYYYYYHFMAIAQDNLR